MLKKIIQATLLALSLSSSATVLAELVNINTADTKIIQDNLNGIGEKKAKAIIDYRTEKGGFKTLEEIQEVKGIGPKLFEKIKAEISLTEGLGTPANSTPAAGTTPMAASTTSTTPITTSAASTTPITTSAASTTPITTSAASSAPVVTASSPTPAPTKPVANTTTSTVAVVKDTTAPAVKTDLSKTPLILDRPATSTTQ